MARRTFTGVTRSTCCTSSRKRIRSSSINRAADTAPVEAKHAAWYDITKGGRIKERDVKNAFRIVRKVEECMFSEAREDAIKSVQAADEWEREKKQRRSNGLYGANGERAAKNMSTETLLFVAPSSVKEEEEEEEEEEDKTKATDPYSSHSEDLRFAYGESLYETKRQHFLEEKSSKRRHRHRQPRLTRSSFLTNAARMKSKTPTNRSKTLSNERTSCIFPIKI